MSSLHIDNSIPAGPNEAVIHAIVKQVNAATIKPMNAAQLDLTINGTMANLLEANIQKQANEYHLTQPKFIQAIMDDLQLMESNVQSKDIPMESSKLLSTIHRLPIIRRACQIQARDWQAHHTQVF